MLIEYGPLVLFFVVNSFYGIYIGTAVLVLTTLMAVGYSWVSTGLSIHHPLATDGKGK